MCGLIRSRQLLKASIQASEWMADAETHLGSHLWIPSDIVACPQLQTSQANNWVQHVLV